MMNGAESLVKTLLASGAVDGYHRMSGEVAATLLHLAPGFGNAFANLHNARKAQSGIVNVMGDHASYHPKRRPWPATGLRRCRQRRRRMARSQR